MTKIPHCKGVLWFQNGDLHKVDPLRSNSQRQGSLLVQGLDEDPGLEPFKWQTLGHTANK